MTLTRFLHFDVVISLELYCLILFVITLDHIQRLNGSCEQ